MDGLIPGRRYRSYVTPTHRRIPHLILPHFHSLPVDIRVTAFPHLNRIVATFGLTDYTVTAVQDVNCRLPTVYDLLRTAVGTAPQPTPRMDPHALHTYSALPHPSPHRTPHTPYPTIFTTTAYTRRTHSCL